MSLFEKHNTLFHYTTASGLQGILKSQSLWATHYLSLSDTQEILFFRNYYRKHLEIALKEMDGIKKGLPEGINKLFPPLTTDTLAHARSKEIDHLFSSVILGEMDATPPFAEPFIVSFCTAKEKYIHKHGLLSQWRGYGQDGGYTIEFDTKILEEWIEDERKHDYAFISLMDVVYGEHEKDSPDFKEDFEKLENIAQIYREVPSDMENYDHMLAETVGKQWEPFVKCMSRLKNPAFHEEKEVRIIACPERGGEDKLVLFTSRKGAIVPYVDLFKDKGKQFEHSIKRIIVGPHPNKTKRAEQLKALLRNKIEVTISEIPYVG